MKRFSRLLVWVAFAILSIISLIACGGGGGSSSVATRGVSVFATDSFRDDWAHVWVTIDKVELQTANGSTTVLDNTASGGNVVDLRTLHDVNGSRFRLLGNTAIAAGTYTGITVTVSKSLTLVNSGGTSTAATFHVSDNTATTKALGLTFGSPITLVDGQKFCVDFALATWVLTGTEVSAPSDVFLALHDTTLSDFNDISKHDKEDFGGTVNSLAGTAPTQTFTIVDGSRSLNVTTDASTTIYNSDGSSSPVLANGSHVRVSGVFDPTAQTLAASAVEIRIGNTTQLASAEGVTAASDVNAKTITLTLREAEGFLPPGQSLPLVTTDTTLFFASSGLSMTEAAFYSSLTTTTKIKVKGSFANGTLTVASARIEEGQEGSGEGDQHHLVLVKGTASALDGTAGTLTVTLTEWEGYHYRSGATVNVTTSGATFYDGANTVSSTTFFSTATTSSVVKVFGTLDTTTGTLAATKVLINSTGGNDYDGRDDHGGHHGCSG